MVFVSDIMETTCCKPTYRLCDKEGNHFFLLYSIAKSNKLAQSICVVIRGNIYLVETNLSNYKLQISFNECYSINISNENAMSYEKQVCIPTNHISTDCYLFVNFCT